jgi:hypothetical protein
MPDESDRIRVRAVSPPSRRNWREEHWLVNLGALVMFLAIAWLVMAGLVFGAAFVVSWAGGDIVAWLLGVPALAALIGFATALIAERVFNRKSRARRR